MRESGLCESDRQVGNGVLMRDGSWLINWSVSQPGDPVIAYSIVNPLFFLVKKHELCSGNNVLSPR